MVDGLYIDNATRKRIVTFWIPVCLGFLHFWATLFAVALVVPAKYTAFIAAQMEHIEGGFEICGWGISALILLLISDKALEFIISRFVSMAPAAGQVIERTTTEKTVTTPALPVANQPTDAQNVEIKAETVNVDSN